MSSTTDHATDWTTRLVRVDPGEIDLPLAAEVAVLWEVARLECEPSMPPETAREAFAQLTYGWDGEPPELTIVRDGTALVAVGTLECPRRDNAHLGQFAAVVDPGHRRRGLGSALLEAALARLRELGRRTVLAEAPEGSAGEGFLRAGGFASASTDVQRLLPITQLDRDRLAEMLAAAQAASPGYRVEAVPIPVPDDRVEALLTVSRSINDAPIDELDLEDEVYDADRLHGLEQSMAMRGRRLHWLLAWSPDGEPAGHTMVSVSAEHPQRGVQLDTSVRREHRGHRLGLRLKLEMLERLRRLEPDLVSITTWNAASNAHMVGVNEAMGHRVERVWHEYQRAVDA
ncbi:MAG TPA: GNAT family N-acetyltransferase [Actinomycetes bacterium]|nr:GNAT family N-acetyltransferase [Actinomycetes bacterium]